MDLAGFVAYIQARSNDGTAVRDLLGFVLKVENYKESGNPVRHASSFKMFLFVSCYQLIKNNHEWEA